MFTQLGQFRWSAFSAWRAARVSLGVTLPLIVGWSTGHLGYGVYMALGSLPAGFASFQGETRSRIAAVALASIGMAVSTFLGAATAAATEPWLLTAIVTLWAYITGLSVCLGQLASVAVLQWSSALLVASGLPLGPQEAALRAGFVFAGGILQAVIIVASWTLQPGSRERSALAASYRAMAAYASQLASGKPQAPPTAAFPAENALRDPNPFLRTERRLAYYMLLEQAERVRASLAAVGAYADGPQAGEVRMLISETASVLECVAEALTVSRERRFAIAREINSRVEQLKIDFSPAWRWSAESLLRQLRAIARMLVWIDTGEAAELETRADPASGSDILRVLTAAGAQLWANVTTTSEAGRHALRLAVVALLAELLARVMGLYQGRWVALTIFFVLKPDYTSTRYRGLQRALGTILGAGVGAAVARFSHLDQGMLIVSTAVCVAAAYALFSVSYLLFSIPLTAFIVLLLALLGMPVAANAEARIADTCIGAALALIAYIVWPTWQGTTGQQIFAALLDTHRDYTTALLRELSHRNVGASRLRTLQAAARRARSDAEAAAARLAEEPDRPPLTPDLAQLLFATITRIAHAELALHVLVLARSDDATRPNPDSLMDRLSNALEAAMTGMADALRNLESPKGIPDLRPIDAEFIDAPDVHADPLASIVDRLVDAIDTLRDVLEKHL